MNIITHLTEIKSIRRIRLSLAVALVSAAMLPVSMSAQSLAESGFIRNSDYNENIEKAVQGNPESQRIVAECYLAGTGVRKDVNEAWKWLVKAAGNGDIESQYIIGTLYRDGNGVRQNYEESAYWFRKAGKNGHHKAQVEIARQFAEGQGVQQDYRIAAENYWRAAEGGEPEGAYYYAKLVSEGRAGMKDLPKALKYYKKAAAAGFGDAREKVRELEAQGVKEPVVRKFVPKKKTTAHSKTSKSRKKRR